LTPYTPQQNEVAERKNRTLIEMARTILDEYKTSYRFWTEVINTACYATNRLYLHKLLKKTSYELLTDNKPNVSYFRVFRSKCYILQKRSKSSKFTPNTYECVLLGYDTTPAIQDLDKDNHEEDVEPNDQDQEESNDQGGDEDDGDKEEAPPHPRVH
jgi:hypothetical protein